jgi:hypothetical protein
MAEHSPRISIKFGLISAIGRKNEWDEIKYLVHMITIMKEVVPSSA